MISRSMAKSIRDSKKLKPKLGRPKTTGSGEAQIVRMHKPQIAAIDAWTKAQGDQISRPEAIRRLVQLGLTVPLVGDVRQSSADGSGRG